MSYSNLVSYVKLSPNCTKPRNHKIDRITIHCVVGQVSVESLGAQFAELERQASSNYGIGTDGRIACFVEEENRSWCSGSRENDHRAITIEVASDTKPPYAVNTKAFAALLDLVEDICRRHNIRPNYTGDKTGNMTLHKWFQATDCPGAFLEGKHPEIAAEVNKRLGATAPAQPANGYTLAQFIKDVQKSCGAAVDGVAGPETIGKTVTISAKKNPRHATVLAVQRRLAVLGYTEVGKADGIAGPKFTSALAHFQQDNGCVVDGEATARCLTWRKLLGMS